MPAPQPLPAAPAPIDYDKMANASIRVAKAQSAEQEAMIKRLYPEYTKLQFDTADQLAGKLDNEYLARTRGVVGEELRAASSPTQIEAELRRRATADLRRGPTAIQQQLLGDAQRELALGQSLSPEEMRNATQSARAAFAARGMATGNAAAGAELLNRDTYGRQRQDQRRQFAMGAEQYSVGMEEQRRAQALGANQLDLARRQRRVGLAGAYGDLDPFRQAIGPAFGLGQSTLSTTTGQVGDIFGGSLQQAGNVESFNTNMAASRYNSVLNNNASLQAAGMQAGAMNNASTMGMIGGIGSGLLQGAGMFALSDKREKKDIKPLGKAGSVLGLTAYEFSYKGDDKKHKGFMAQDVKKVLPEAVAEVDYKGKKRLAIKPAVIGAALAEELMAAKAA
jgi:hypothetical protein